MSSRSRVCDADRFSIELNDILSSIVDDSNNACSKAVKKACKRGKEEAVKNASNYGWEHYPKGFAYTTSKRRLTSFGEVGNKKLPGLVHLLEKGHAKMNGGRVEARPHLAPAADVAFEYFWEQVEKNLGDVL